MTYSNNQGFTLVEVLIVVTLLGILTLAFTSSQVKNLQARKTVEGKLGYQEVSSSVRSMLGQLLRNPPSSGCLSFDSLQQSTASSQLLSLEKDVVAGLGAKTLEFLTQPRNELIRQAADRCRQTHDIQALNDANDNLMYFCTRFKKQALDTDSFFLNSSHAFAEFRLEFINAQDQGPLSCLDYRNSKQAGVNVYYNIYWLSGKGNDPSYTRQTGYYYVGK